MVREVLVEGLAPPLGVRLRVGGLELAVVDVVVGGDAVVEAVVGEGQRDVVLDVEGTVGVVGAHARQPQALGLLASVETTLGPVVVRLRVVDREQPDAALVDVRPGVVHAVVVEPEEALLLPVVAAGRPVEVQVVAPLTGPVALGLRAVAHGVVRVAVTLRGGVAVVQVGQEGAVGGAEVLGVEPGVLVQVVVEPDDHRLAVLGVDPRQAAVELPRGARRLGAGRAGGHGGLAPVVERRDRLALVVDRQHLRRGERVLGLVHVELVDLRPLRPRPA